MKATFNVTLVHDPGLIALSNMPVYQSEVKDGWKYDRFDKTVKMSTYLAAFAVGDFKYKQTKTDNGIQVWNVNELRQRRLSPFQICCLQSLLMACSLVATFVYFRFY